MLRFIIKGGKKLEGATYVSGAKNVALKTLVAACLTNEQVIIKNIPLISDFLVMADIIRELGGEVSIKDHTVEVRMKSFATHKISLDRAAEIRTSAMFIAPLLARVGAAEIPNPGGCRIGARPIDRVVRGLTKMGAAISYRSEDGYFHAKTKGLHGATYKFEKNSHTGTETLIVAAVLAKGKTVLENAAEEPEVDELISFLNSMGAKIKRIKKRTILIEGVEKVHGTDFTISPDRNEIVTLAVASYMTGGDILVRGARKKELTHFLQEIEKVGGKYEENKDGIRFFSNGKLEPSNVVTSPYPGFMTDWQGPWTALMTKANGKSLVHEAVYESRFGYVEGLLKMGASIELFNPKVKNPKQFYNFNLKDDNKDNFHAARISGPTPLHNAVVEISDLRAGATLVLAALSAKGESVIFGIEHLDRGYENLEKRLKALGARIRRENGE